MLFPENSSILTNEGHYPLSEVGERLVWDGDGWVAPAFSAAGEIIVFNIQVSVDGRPQTVTGSGLIPLADGTIVEIEDLVVQSEVQSEVPELDENGNPLVNEQGEPVMRSVTTIVPGSQLKSHELSGANSITVVSKSEAGVMQVYESASPIALSCGIFAG